MNASLMNRPVRRCSTAAAFKFCLLSSALLPRVAIAQDVPAGTPQDQAAAIADQAAKNAGPAKATQIEVTVHTDTVGSDAHNLRLSRRRAESVAAELEKQGVPSSDIAIFAKGKRDLLVPTGDGVKEPQNRRVQIVCSGASTS